MNNMQGLSNVYQEEIEKNQLEKKEVLGKLKKNNSEMNKNLLEANIKLGEDSKVEEVVLVTFLTSLYKNFNDAYEAYKRLKERTIEERFDGKIETAEEKAEKIKEFQEKADKANEYTQLNIEKVALEKELQKQDLSAAKKEENETKLVQVTKKMFDIQDLFEFAGDSKEFIDELNKYENDVYGEEAAKEINELREASGDTLKDFAAQGVDILNSADNETVLQLIKDKLSTFAQKGVETIATNLQPQTQTQTQTQG